MMKRSDNQVISYLMLRQLLGWLGMFLPVSMFVFSQLNGWTPIRTSISSYYFTNAREIFEGIMFAMAFFLITYKGYSKLDNRITNFAGFFAMLIALFPAMRDCDSVIVNLVPFLSNTFTDGIHTLSASLFFGLLAFISICLFTKQGDTITPMKLVRNRVYRICGFVILTSLAILGIYLFWLKKAFPELEVVRPIFFLESVMLFAFGISWLVKGEAFFKDK